MANKMFSKDDFLKLEDGWLAPGKQTAGGRISAMGQKVKDVLKRRPPQRKL